MYLYETYHLVFLMIRNVPVDKREPIVTRARELISGAGFKIGTAHCALESKPPVAWDKGRASIYILRTAFGVDWSDRYQIQAGVSSLLRFHNRINSEHCMSKKS